MAFSGQYAAAQLDQLDRSPLFRGYTFPLAAEVSEYLGFVNDLVPPTLLRWSRELGRLACITRTDGIPVMLDELEGFEFAVRVSWPVFGIDPLNGSPAWIWEEADGTVDEHYRMARAPIIDAKIMAPQTFNDVFFYANWSIEHRNSWPCIANDTVHPVLERLIAVYRRFAVRCWSHNDLIWRAIRRRNRAIRPLTESDSDFGMESDDEL